MKIRKFLAEDTEYEAIVAVHNAAWPDEPETVGRWRYWDENRNPEYPYQRYVVDVDGTPAAYGSYGQTPWSYQPGKYGLDVTVHPAYQKQGIGSALYQFLLEILASREPVRLTADTREDRASAIRFLNKRGFKQVMRYPISKLTLASFRPENFTGRVRRALNGGVTIRSLADLRREDPEWRGRAYELEWELLQDVPSPDPIQRISTEDYDKQVLNHPSFVPEAYFVALDGERWVGMSNLWRNEAKERQMNTGLTGVVRSHRRRGIATALKVEALTYAQTSGIEEVETGNEENNPMLELNRQLGFRPTPAWLDFEKDLQAERANENGGNDVSSDQR